MKTTSHVTLALACAPLGVCAVSCAVDDGPGAGAVQSSLTEAVPTTDYPAVCALGGRLFGPDGPTIVGCSGTLIAPNVVLTAGHCFPPPEMQEILWPSAFGGVNCNPDVSDSLDWHPGTFHSDGYVEHRRDDPSYDNHDIAVIVLDDPILDVKPAKLPHRGFLDHLFESPGTARAKLTLVGYGSTNLDDTVPDVFFPYPEGVGTRRMTTARAVGLNDYYLFSEPDPGRGWYSDSGGPVFLADSNIVLAHNTDLLDPHMWHYRSDTAEAQEFLSQFLDD